VETLPRGVCLDPRLLYNFTVPRFGVELPPGMLDTAYTAWQRCDKQLAKKPRLKGQQNKLTSASAQHKTSIPFPDPFTVPDRTHFHVLGKAVGVRRMWGGS
jgi:hypothetical protein